MELSKVYEPTSIESLNFANSNNKVSKIFCGGTFSLFLTTSGEVYACGANDLGQLGLDPLQDDLQALEKMKRQRVQSDDVVTPAKLYCLEGQAVQTLACGESHVLATAGLERNMLWSWGNWRNGQLGLGEVSVKMNPRPI